MVFDTSLHALLCRFGVSDREPVAPKKDPVPLFYNLLPFGLGTDGRLVAPTLFIATTLETMAGSVGAAAASVLVDEWVTA